MSDTDTPIADEVAAEIAEQSQSDAPSVAGESDAAESEGDEGAEVETA